METRSLAGGDKTGVDRRQASLLFLSLEGPLLCHSRARRPFLPRPACSCPGNQGPVIHPELPSLWSGGETAEPVVGVGDAACLPSSGAGLRAIGLVQNGGGGGLGWAPHCGRGGGRVTGLAPTLSNSEAWCQPQSTNGMTS